MVKVIWSPRALGDLEQVREYLLGEASDQATARVCGGIISTVETLAEHPRSGWRESNIAEREIRNRLYGHYRIMYEVCDDGSIIIVTIRHTSRDAIDLLH